MNLNIKNYECINSIYISSKTKFIKKFNILVLIINKKFSKKDIKKSILNIFKLKVKKINILNTKSKVKKFKNNLGYTKSYKKAYIFFYKNDFEIINKINYKYNNVIDKI